MTSKFGASECYVYITLPGESTFVTAARFVHNVDRDGVPLGRLIYGRSYLARPNAVPIDPLELKLGTRTYETRLLKGVFGGLRDGSPDYWGRRVIEKHSGKSALTEVDYLLYSPDDRAGALSFGLNPEPPAPQRRFNQSIDLERLQALADAVIKEDEADQPSGDQVQQIEELLLLGTSMGGARPKVVVEDQGSLWLAKFNRTDDRWNNARVEHAMLELARECGIQSAESRIVVVGDRDVLLVRRFDRQPIASGYRRARMLSALTLLRAGETLQHRDRWSYVLLAEELRRLSAQPKEDTPQLFRRMVFNALISNIDDHPRNHAVIALDTDFRLAPAYDLTPAAPVSLERRDLAMICGDAGRYAHADNLLSQCARFLLTREDAGRIIDVMEKTVKSRWYEVARRHGVSERDCQNISGAFAYEGFRLKSPQREPAWPTDHRKV
jgi:serine/threonine-protein kinase HipA